jgi:RepB DNA-primase from phage plasmid
MGRSFRKSSLPASLGCSARNSKPIPGSADWRHFGRLAGFTNRKQKHQQPDGFFPFVKLLEASGEVYPQAKAFVPKSGKLSMSPSGLQAASQLEHGRDVPTICVLPRISKTSRNTRTTAIASISRMLFMPCLTACPKAMFALPLRVAIYPIKAVTSARRTTLIELF